MSNTDKQHLDDRDSCYPLNRLYPIFSRSCFFLKLLPPFFVFDALLYFSAISQQSA